MLIRTRAEQAKQAVASIEATFRKFNPPLPFKYAFTDQGRLLTCVGDSCPY